MFGNTSFGKSLDVMQRTMDVSILRREVISNNIANAETPNFKRTDVNFEASLAKAIASENQSGFSLKLTHEKHIPNNRPVSYKTIKPRRVLDFATQTDANGNNVDIEKEMMDITKNQMRYQLMTQSISNQFKKIDTVIK